MVKRDSAQDFLLSKTEDGQSFGVCLVGQLCLKCKLFLKSWRFGLHCFWILLHATRLFSELSAHSSHAGNAGCEDHLPF